MTADFRAAGLLLRLAIAGCALGLTGCSTSPFLDSREQDLRRAVVESIRDQIDDAELRPQPRQLDRVIVKLPINEKFYPELDAMAGPASRDFAAVDYGTDLMGIDARPVGISLHRAIRAAVNHNLEVQFARLAPAISESDVTGAEAAFDWIFFSNLNWNNQDQISPASPFGVSNGYNERQSVQSITGIRRQLESGGQFSVQQELIYTDNETEGLTITPDPATQAALAFQFDQPLLRNFGSDVALAQVRINRNAERDSIARLRVQLLQAVNQTEATYWELVRAQHDLAILERLLERGLNTRNQLQARVDAQLDVPPSQLADAIARVQRRKTDVTRARDAVRDASDRLKVLMNDPDFPVGSEILLTPLDQPVDEAMRFSLVETLTTAVTHRPEIDQAILSIDNTSIRETVAANQRMPQLNFQLQARFQGLNDGIGAVSNQFDGDFVDYIVALAFEQPIGNRAAEAEYIKRRLEREQAILSYRNTVQQIVRDVKASLRAVARNYQIIEQARMSRIAAAESLRTLQVENEQIRERSSERLELEFNRQESLSNAERTEIQAITDYNASVAQLHAAMGTALQRNKIMLAVPTATEALGRRHSADWYASLGANTAESQTTEQPQ
ncbi:hypothetical protein MNBD_PLANCTO03-1171, partial [hydrothermal vent metagenome]